jgi:hypothetical protein
MDVVNAADAVGAPDATPGDAAQRARLLAEGLTAAQAARLIALKREQARRPPEGMSAKRLRFVRWLVAHGRLHEGGPAAHGGTAIPYPQAA